MNTIQIRIQKSLGHGCIIGTLKSDDGRAYMSDITFQRAEEGVAIPDNKFFRLDDTQAQALMDDLWSCGVRPTDGAGSAGAMAQAQEHIGNLLADIGHLRNMNTELIKAVTRGANE